jgi:hypothetical protein
VLSFALVLAVQVGALELPRYPAGGHPRAPGALADSVLHREPAPRLGYGPDLGAWLRLRLTIGDTVRQRRQLVEYSDLYTLRMDIHRVLSWAMIPLFVGSAYTGFQLRNKGEEAPQWTRDIHGPLAAGTAIVFGMNTLTGVWNLIEGRKDPEGRTRRLVHGMLFLAAGAGFAYVTAAGDNIHELGRSNHWHRDVALGSMGVSLVSWSLMALFR